MLKTKKSTLTQGTKGIAGTQLWIIERKSGKRKLLEKMYIHWAEELAEQGQCIKLTGKTNGQK